MTNHIWIKLPKAIQEGVARGVSLSPERVPYLSYKKNYYTLIDNNEIHMTERPVTLKEIQEVVDFNLSAIRLIEKEEGEAVMTRIRDEEDRAKKAAAAAKAREKKAQEAKKKADASKAKKQPERKVESEPETTEG